MMSLTANPRNVNAQDFPGDGSVEEQWCFLLQYALLAPSEYNTQPWLFRVQGKSVEIYLDWSRRLPVADPEDRELFISAGAACLNLRLAARWFGYQVLTECVLDDQAPSSALLARLSFGMQEPPTEEESRLFSAIPHRQSNRSLFEQRPVPRPLLERMELHVGREGTWLHLIQDTQALEEIARLIVAGDQQQWADKQFRAELAQWLHPRAPANLDGLPGEAEPRGSSQKTTNPLVVRTYNPWQEEVARDQRLLAGAPLIAVLGTFTDSCGDWFAAGMALERVLLEACSSGLQTSFVNQPIQVPSLRAKLTELLGRKAAPQLILRLGYGQPVPLTPRRRVCDVLVDIPVQR